MDAKFSGAQATIKAGDVEGLSAILERDPSLATARSSVSHPTLLQCLVLRTADVHNSRSMAQLLIDRGADIHQPLIAAASIDNVDMVQFLLDAGAAIDGDARWSPLEEALYWSSQRSLRVLLAHGAAIKNLRTAAGVGPLDAVTRFFNDDGSLKPDAGVVESPFKSLHIGARARESQAIIDNAFVYACMHGHIDIATYLLDRGALVDAIPAGFDYAGTALHYAAFQGHRAMVEFLLDRGADPTVKDAKVNTTPANWADHRGHAQLRVLLEQREQQWRDRLPGPAAES